MSTIIKVETLGKKYTISHRRREEASSLRELLANCMASLSRNVAAPFRKSSTGLSNLAAAAEDFWALKDVSFEVRQGDRIGIIGRNGAGKSTLLKILSRITEPTTGSIRIKGRVASLLEVGTGFHQELTGRENIFLNGAILGMQREEIRRKFDEIVDFAEIEKFLDTPVKHYSSGMYVRLAFAVAAHLEPEILIVDEVLAVGDAQFQKKCLGKMENVGKEGRTVLFVSHNMTAVRALCSRAILFHGGELKSDGHVETSISAYLGGIGDQTHVQEWLDNDTAPQNASAVILKVAVCDSNGSVLNEITTDTEIHLEIIFRVKNAGASIGLTLIIYDTDNTCLFSSINNGEPMWYGRAMPEGIYRSICIIPGYLLNNRIFTFTMNLFGRSFSDVLTLTDIIKINVNDTITVRRDFLGECGGYFRPDFDWTTKRI